MVIKKNLAKRAKAVHFQQFLVGVPFMSKDVYLRDLCDCEDGEGQIEEGGVSQSDQERYDGDFMVIKRAEGESSVALQTVNVRSGEL